jgi:hypothetical protein
MLETFRRLFSTKQQATPVKKSKPVNLHVTLWPAFEHFRRFAHDGRMQGIRLNSAMMEASEIDSRFALASRTSEVPLWFDVKGMQMRIREVVPSDRHLEFILNRPVKVKTPCTVYFKAGEDRAVLKELSDDGYRFIFEGGPKYIVKAGESIHVLEEDLEVGGEPFLPYEIAKIEKVKGMGIKRWCLSYAYEQKHIDEFREMIGPDAHLYLKIENMAGLKYVGETYKKMPNTNLFTARGDMFIEIPRPHEILKACKFVLEKDEDALVGSRMLLSLVEPIDYVTKTVQALYSRGKVEASKDVARWLSDLKPKYNPVPSAADLSELAWLYDIGYRTFLLCDELCLKEHMLSAAVNVFDAFRADYCET